MGNLPKGPVPPRGPAALPGMTAGTCLRKDFAFSEERSDGAGMLLAASRVNETVPLFLVDGLVKRLGSLRGHSTCVPRNLTFC